MSETEQQSNAVPVASTPPSASISTQGGKIPPDKINVRVIVITGQTADLLCLPEESAQSIVDRLYESWPSHWDAQHRPATNILRLIYQGRFLHGSVTLSGDTSFLIKRYQFFNLLNS